MTTEFFTSTEIHRHSSGNPQKIPEKSEKSRKKSQNWLYTFLPSSPQTIPEKSHTSLNKPPENS
jgi:hypothetical protein